MTENSLSDRNLNNSIQALTLSDIRRPDAPLIYVNSGFEKLTGYQRNFAVGRNCRFLQGPDTSKETVSQMRAAVAEGKSLIVDVLNYRKNGTAFWNRLSLTPVKDESGIATHYIGIQSDISDMRSLQERLFQIALKLGRTPLFLID